MFKKTLILSLVLCFAFSCTIYKNHPSTAFPKSNVCFDHSRFQLKPGDLLFQDSDCGPFCTSIEKVTMGVQGSKFSHVGMVIPNENGEIVVIEAISAGVVETHLDSFFMRSFDDNNNSKVVVGRIKDQSLIPDAIQFAKTKIGIPYDDVFDLSNDKYYCSELIYDAFKFANNNQPIFQLQKMTYIDPETNQIFPIWEDYFHQLDVPIPEGKPGLNPGGMSTSKMIEIVHFYGIPDGYKGTTP